MKITLRYDIGDGPVEVTTRIATIVAWEAKYKSKAGSLGDGIGMTDLAFFAHHASVQSGLLVPLTQESFTAKLELLEVVDQIEAANPTEAAGD